MTPTRVDIAWKLTCQSAGCAGKPSTDCTILTGPNKGKPRKGLGLHAGRLKAGDEAIAQGYAPGFADGAASRQGEVDQITEWFHDSDAAWEELIVEHEALQKKFTETADSLKTAQDNLAASEAQRVNERNVAAALVANFRAQIAALTKPPVVVNEPKHPIPANPVWISPSGNDNNPGTESKPRATPIWNKPTVLDGGTYNGFTAFAPNGSAQSWYVPAGKTAVFDGQGKIKRAITAGGRLDLFGDLRIDNYAPDYANNVTPVALYYGGTSVGSEIDGVSINKSGMAGLGFQVPLILNNLAVTAAGYSGILGTTADGTTFGNVSVVGVNRLGRAQDGQLGGIKLTRSKDLYFSPNVLVTDTNGANGLWCDVSCRNPHVDHSKVLTGTGKPAPIGLLFEQAEGGAVTGAQIEGVYAAECVSSGHMKWTGNKFTATSVALTVTQDRAQNSGTKPENLPPADAPWLTIGNTFDDNELTATGGFNIALTTLTKDGGLGRVTTPDMIASLKRNRYTGTVQLETTPGKRQTYTAAQLAGVLGAKFA